MKIKELRITKFGTIKNLTIKPTEKLNYIYGLNEAEKTSVVDFILIMLYGTVNSYREDVREKYLPDDGSDISGSIDFEYKGESITLDRIFNAGRYKKDKIKITNHTKETTEDLPYNVRPGEYLFGISKDIFQRNAYINESESISMLKTSHTKIMSSLLSNLISTASETTLVSNVAKTLNSYCDPVDENSISFRLDEKRTELENLKEDLKSALETENTKITHQKYCDDLHARFAEKTKKYEKIKTVIELQELLSEAQSLKSTEFGSEERFRNVSDQYNEIKSDLSHSKVKENRAAFDKAREKYKRLKSFKRDQLAATQKSKNLNVELGRYTPKGDQEALQKIIEMQNKIEQSNDTLNVLRSQLSEKKAELSRIQTQLLEAKDNYDEAENALLRHEEISSHKILQAEAELHQSSETVEVAPVEKSKNLIFAVFLLVVFIALLIIFLTNIFAVVILSALIFSDVYAIFKKIGKEKTVKQHSRIDENQMRYSEMNLRNLKNSCSAERDSLASKSAFVRNQYEDIKKISSSLKNQIGSLEKEIASTENSIEICMSQRAEAEKKVSPPDPKFYSIRSEINDLHISIRQREAEMEEIRSNILEDLSSIRSFQNFEDAENFIENNSRLLEKYDSLSSELEILGNSDKARTAKEQNEKRLLELEKQIQKITRGKDASMISPEEYQKLKDMSHTLLEEISEIKDQYINAITNMKIQYNDSKCAANLEHRIVSLEKEIQEADNFLKSVKIAIDAYNDSLYEIRDKFAPSVARRTSEILAEITEDKYTSISIKGGKIVIKDKNRTPVNFDTISKSTCDQIYFALRLAVSEITAGNMLYPIILDDIFFRFSETKSINLLRFLVKYSEKSQILIINNTNQISSVISQNQIPVDNITMISV